MPSAVPKGSTKRFGTARPSAASRPGAWRRRMADPAQAFPAPASEERGSEDAECDRGDAGRNLAAARGHADRHGADGQHERGHAEQQANRPPDDLEDAEQFDVRGHGCVPNADEHVDACERRPWWHHARSEIARRPGRRPARGARRREMPADRHSRRTGRTIPATFLRVRHSGGRSRRTGMPTGIVVPSERFEGREDDLGRQILRGRSRQRRNGACGRAGPKPRESRWRPRRRSSAAPGRRVSRHRADRVVGPAASRIGQDFVGAGRLEEGDRAVVSRNVGMIPAGQLPVGALDLVSARVRRHAQNVVVVPHRADSGYVATGDTPIRYDRG